MKPLEKMVSAVESKHTKNGFTIINAVGSRGNHLLTIANHIGDVALAEVAAKFVSVSSGTANTLSMILGSARSPIESATINRFEHAKGCISSRFVITSLDGRVHEVIEAFLSHQEHPWHPIETKTILAVKEVS